MAKHNNNYHLHSSCSHCIHLCEPCDQVYCCQCIRTWGGYTVTWGGTTTIGSIPTVWSGDTGTLTGTAGTTSNTVTYHSSANHKHTN